MVARPRRKFLVWDPTSKGTAHCLAAIRRAGKPYEILSLQPTQLPLGSSQPCAG